MTDRRLLAGALGLAVLVAACGSSAATATPAATQAPSQAAATQPPAATPVPGDTTEPSMPAISLAPGNAGDLEAMIPSTVGGLTLQKTSFDGASIPLAGTPIDNTKLDPLLAKYGKSMADLRFAMGIGTSATGATMIYALQVRGVPATEFMNQVGSSADATNKLTIGGKTVYGESGSGMSSIVYPKGDVLFMVVASDKDAQAIVSALP